MDKIIYTNMLDGDSEKNLIETVIESTEHANELVLEGWNVYILLEGIVDDGEDYYWRLLVPYEGIKYTSCVCGVHYLKDKIDADAYNQIYNLFKINYPIWKGKKMREMEKRHEDEESRLKESFKEIEELFNGSK